MRDVAVTSGGVDHVVTDGGEVVRVRQEQSENPPRLASSARAGQSPVGPV